MFIEDYSLVLKKYAYASGGEPIISIEHVPIELMDEAFLSVCLHDEELFSIYRDKAGDNWGSVNMKLEPKAPWACVCMNDLWSRPRSLKEAHASIAEYLRLCLHFREISHGKK